jgi:hypothetical protein
VARRASVLEAAAAGAGGAALGYVATRVIGAGMAGAIVGGTNGALSGWRGVYDWRHPRGAIGFVLDSTWGLVGVAAGLVVHALSSRRSPGYVAALSRRRGHHVYERGWSPRRGFAFTAGNVITGAGDPTDPRRQQLVERHEGLHVWQQRMFGPFFPVFDGAWMAGGAVSGTLVWARRRGSLFATIERHAYYYNPFERWAYVHDGHWPPARMQRARVN